MKILVTGAGGMLGSDLVKALRPHFDVIGAGRRDAPPHLTDLRYWKIDLTDPESIARLCAAEKPRLIFHTAGMTQVDLCELDRTAALRGNLEATKNVVAASNRSRSTLIFFSTDYIFDGKKRGEYTEDDPAAPRNVYGESKLLAEKYIQQTAGKFLIFRISWLYGLHGASFPRTLLERAKTERKFKIVSDQTGRPTYTADLANFFLDVLSANENALERLGNQTFHWANEGIASWAEFGSFILSLQYGNAVSVEFVSSREVPRPARRPQNSILSLRKMKGVFGFEPRHWQEAAGDFFQEYRQFNPIQKDIPS